VRETRILGKKVVVKHNMNIDNKYSSARNLLIPSDILYYKTYYLSNAHKDFRNGFAPKVWDSLTDEAVRTSNREGKYMCRA